MPYDGQLADKAAHIDILKNPDVDDFLSNCNYLKPPSDEEIEQIAALFIEPPRDEEIHLPDYIIAIDGSNYEASIDEKLPSTKMGYIKIGAVLIPLKDFDNLRKGYFVDPFRVADLQKNSTALTFMAPSANISWNSKGSVRDSFRAYIDTQLSNPRFRFDEKNYRTSLRTTLFHLASLREDGLGSTSNDTLFLHKCPTCDERRVEVKDIEEDQFCPNCGEPVYPSDCLRIWEEVSEFQSNQVALSRLMMVLEHILPIHYLRQLGKQPLFLSELGLFIDGPLAIFGNAAWLHRSIMKYLHALQSKVEKKANGASFPLIGLVKTGAIIDHVNLIEKHLPNNCLFAISDEYRYQYVHGGRQAAKQGFGFETYYGQDFIYKTPTGRTFVFLLPYHWPGKKLGGKDFIKEKLKLENYPELSKAIQLIDHFESDLHENAVVPIALAHRYTAISLQPGGKVLDLLAHQALNNN